MRQEPRRKRKGTKYYEKQARKRWNQQKERLRKEKKQ